MFSKLSHKEFVLKLRFVRPSKKYNQMLLQEIVKRGLCNDLYVLNYINELRNLGLFNYDAQCILLSKYDLSDRSSKFLKTKIEYCEMSGVFYSLKKVANSIKRKKMTTDFDIFISALESILMSTKNRKVEDGISRIEANINHMVINDFLTLVKKFRTNKFSKNDFVILKDFKDGSFSYRESWFWVFTSKVLSEFILFVFYFLCFENQKCLKYQILRKMIEEEIGGDELEIFKEMEKRFEHYLDIDIFDDINEEYKEKKTVKNLKYEIKNDLKHNVKEDLKNVIQEDLKNEIKNEKPVKANDEIQNWYKMRVDSFIKSED